MSQLASDAKISSAMAALGMTAPLPNLDDSQVLKAILVALGNVVPGGGGGTGDVVGPASSTDGAVVLWDGVTGKLIKNSAVFITGGGTVALGGFTLTIPATGTVALLGTANTFTAANIFSANGAASTPAVSLTGTVFTGGTATTTKPLFLIEPTGTASTGWSTDGTMFGVNAPSGFVGLLLDSQVDGVSKFRVDKDGIIGLSGASVMSYRTDVGMLMLNQVNTTIGVVGIGSSGFLPGVNLGVSAGLRWTNDMPASSPDVVLARETGGVLFLSTNGSAGATLQMAEQAAPSAPSANQVRIYAKDDGAGKTQLMALFSSGAEQQIAIQP